MGLVKETLEAIIRIDQNLIAIRKALTNTNYDTLNRATPIHTPVETTGSIFNRVLTERDFCYPDSLTFGGRLRAVRLYARLNQTELADDIGISGAHVSKLESDLAEPSAMLIRAVSRRYNIDEQWLATGELPQTAEEVTMAEAFKQVLMPKGECGDGGKLLTLDQMAEQVENLKEAYPQTTQSKSNLTPVQLYQTQGKQDDQLRARQ